MYLNQYSPMSMVLIAGRRVSPADLGPCHPTLLMAKDPRPSPDRDAQPTPCISGRTLAAGLAWWDPLPRVANHQCSAHRPRNRLVGAPLRRHPRAGRGPQDSSPARPSPSPSRGHLARAERATAPGPLTKHAAELGGLVDMPLAYVAAPFRIPVSLGFTNPAH